MSDSEESGITYTAVSSPYEDLSDIGSPRADDHELLELPYMPEDPYFEAALQAPPSPDYEACRRSRHAPPIGSHSKLGRIIQVSNDADYRHSREPDYVPGPEQADDEIVAEDQPYAEDASPIALSPDYVPESDPEADPEEDDDEDPEEDPIDYPADGGDDGDDEMDIEEDEDDDMDIEADEEDEDDEMEVEIDEEAEEEHLAPAYPVVVALPATAPITIPEPLPVPAWSDSEVARLLAISSPPASPLSPWSSSPPQIPFPLSPPSPVLTAPPPSPIRSLGYRAATIRMRAEAAATFPREEEPEVPTHLDGIMVSAPGPQVRRDPERYVGYGITDSWDEIVETLQGAPGSTDTELGAHMREFESMVRRDIDEIYMRLDDEQGQRQLLAGEGEWMASDLAHLRGLYRYHHSFIAQDVQRSQSYSQRILGDKERCQICKKNMTTEALGDESVEELLDRTQCSRQIIQTMTGQQGPAGGPAPQELPEEAGSSS
ncbi:hypothetical protein Tco_1092563 [Tanacetum coccineum]|uniref:Uncharacterized protein n=1 Tax=Tanacetum coccineum TaxID=301880 RepID=A0ABQ5IAK8_9ASTR